MGQEQTRIVLFIFIIEMSTFLSAPVPDELLIKTLDKLKAKEFNTVEDQGSVIMQILKQRKGEKL